MPEDLRTGSQKHSKKLKMVESGSTEATITVSSIFDLTDDINIIEKSFVAENTTVNYIRGLTTFIICLFDHNWLYLEEDVVTKMILKDEFDKAAREAPPRKNHTKRKGRKLLYKNKFGIEKNLRDLCVN